MIIFKRLLLLATIALAMVGCISATVNMPKKERKVAVQAYTFNRFTLEETIQKIKDIGLDGIECYPGQKLSAKYPNVKVGIGMNAEQRAYMKKLLADAGLKMVSFGVTRTNNEKEIEESCKFAKEFDCDRVLTEDCVARFPAWQEIGKKYGVTMCLHHHGLESPNQYYDPDVVLKYTGPYDQIKTNPDVGHAHRAGFDPNDALRRYKGKIGSIHIKDHDKDCVGVPLGKGVLDIAKMLKLLDAQGYDGFFVIEHEVNFDNNLEEVKECLKFLREN